MSGAISTTEMFLIAMGIIFSVPYLIWRLLRTDYYAPLVVVQILTGILLGPGILGKIFPAYYAFVFRPAVVGSLNGIAWWAVMLFVCVAGIELDLKKAWSCRAESGSAAALALGVPFLFGCAAAAGLLLYPGWIGAQARNWQFVLGVGMACAVTAVPVLLFLMERLQILRQPIGQRILRYASLDDIAIWAVFAPPASSAMISRSRADSRPAGLSAGALGAAAAGPGSGWAVPTAKAMASAWLRVRPRM